MIRTLATLAIFAAALAPLVHGQEAASDAIQVLAPPQPEAEFRRVYVPAERVADWPLSEGSYLPIPRAEFERRIEAIRAREATSPAAPTEPAIESARYVARFDGEDLIGQVGEWRVARPDGANDRLPIDTNLAFDRLGWLEADTANPRMALLGVGSAGRQRLLVERSGTLRFGWSARGQSVDDEAWKFDLRLPAAAANRLELSLPLELVPRAPGAIVTELAANERERNWLLELGSATRVALTLQRAATGAAPATVELRERLTYEISQRGLELTADFSVDHASEPLQSLSFEVADELTVLVVDIGGTAVHWSHSAADDGRSRIVVSPPKPLEPGASVRVSAMGTLALGKNWNLPTIRPVGLEPQEGRLACRVLAPLVLESLEPTSCRQVSAGRLSAPLAGDLVEFQTFAPDRALAVSVVRQPPLGPFVSATALSIVGDELVARTHLRARAQDARLFQLRGEVQPGWFIESIESDPAGRISNWFVDPSTQPASLRIALDGRAGPTDVLALRVAARKLDWVSDKPHRLGDLSPLHMDSPDANASGKEQQWVSLELASDAIVRFTDNLPAENTPLDPAIERIFPAPFSTANLFRVDERNADRRMVIDRGPAGFTAQVEIAATVDSTVLRESYNMQCQPAGGPIERVRVEFAAVGEARLEWPTQTTEGVSLVATRVADEGREIWDVALAKPQTAPFTLTATRERVAAEEIALALASLPDARQQRASVALQTSAGSSVAVHSAGPRPIPAPDARQVAARYEYQPSAVRATDPPALRVTLADQPVGAALLVWLESSREQIDPAGHQFQEVRYLLENQGAKELVVVPPAGLEVVKVTVDGRTVAARLDEQRVSIPLVDTVRFSAVTLELRGRGKPWGILATHTVRFPEVAGGAIVLARQGRFAATDEYIPLNGLANRSASAPRLATRLFGLLSTRREQPLEASFSLQSSPLSETFARSLGQAAFGRGRAATWGEALERVATDLAQQADRRLLVDRAAAAAIGVGSDTPLPSGMPGDSLADQARGLLSEFGLSLMEDAEYLVLTSAGISQALAGQADPRRDAERFVAPARWPAGSAHPWFAVGRASFASAPAGWAEHFASADQAMRFAHAPSIALAGWLVFIGSLGIALVLARDRFAALAWALVAALVAAILIPAPWIPLASGLVLGLSLALATAFLLGCREAAPHADTTHSLDPRYSSRARAVAVGALLFALCFSVSRATESEAQVHEVLFPVDSERRPVGDHVYVPERLWQRIVAAEAPEREDWLLSNARYSGELTWDAARRQLLLPRIDADFQLMVGASGGVVRIPLAPDAALSGWTLRIDGRDTTAWFEERGRALAFRAPEPGLHQLSLRFVPPVRQADGSASLDIPLPPIVDARLELAVPGDVPALEFQSAQGAVRRNDQGRNIICYLGGADRLAFAWQAFASSLEANATVEFDEWLWCRIRPGNVSVDAKFQFDKPVGMTEARFIADRRLRWVASEDPTAAAPQVAPLDATRQLVTFPLAADATGTTSLQMRFLLPDRSGLGRLTLPLVTTASGHARRRWLAVSVDPSLSLEEIDTAGAQSASVDEFAAAWRTGDARPDRAYLLDDSVAPWTIATRPSAARIDAETRLTLSAGPKRLDVNYQARLKVATINVFQHRFHVPPDLRIESLSLQADGGEQIVRWTKDEQGAVTAILASLPQGEQQLELRGWLPTHRSGELPVPEIRWSEARVNSSELVLERRADTLISLHDSSLREAAIPEEPPAASDLVRVGRYQAEGGRFSGKLVVAPNRPRVQATLVTRMFRAAESWRASVECDLRVADGSLDTLRFAAPTTWTGPFASPDGATLTSRPSFSETGEVVARLAEPITDRGALRWEAPVAMIDSQLRVPRVALRGQHEVKQYVALPADEADHWNLIGLQRVGGSPAELRDDASGAYVYYECLEPKYTAIRMATGEGERRSRILHQAVDCFAAEGARLDLIVATFDLLPQGNPAVGLTLPAGAQLAQALIDGAPAAVSAPAEHHFTVQLRSDRLPQRIEIVMRPAVDDAHRLQSPVLVADPPERVYWRTHSRAPLDGAPGEAMGTAAFCQERLDQALASLKLGRPLADSAESAEFAARWTALARESDQRLADALKSAAADQREALNARVAKSRQSLAAANAAAESASAAPARPIPASLSASAAWEGSGLPDYVVCSVTDRDSTTLSASMASRSSDLSARLALALCVVAAAVVAYRFVERTIVERFARRWPLAILAIVGALCWALLSPGLLGLALLLIAACAALAEYLRERLLSARWQAP